MSVLKRRPCEFRLWVREWNDVRTTYNLHLTPLFSSLVAMSLDTAHSFSGGQDQLKHKLPSVVIGMEQALPRHVLSFASPFTTVTLQPTSSKTLSVGGQEFTAGNRRYTLACEDQGEAIVWENATAHGGM